MRKITYIFLVAVVSILFASCDNDVNKDNSIFDTTPPERNEFDLWLLSNYTSPYNIKVLYRMETIESDLDYDLSPANMDKSIALSILVKHLWLEVYDETVSVDFTRSYIPKAIQFIGSPAYKSNGSVVLGTAEGGKKVTLYDVNSINVNNISFASLRSKYFHTMHHEFAHIFHQNKSYPERFNSITDGLYVGDNCFSSENTLSLANKLGFVTRYARTSPNEDFVEVYSVYVTSTQNEWNAILVNGGEEGAATINKKLEIVDEYMKAMWGLDINKVRKSIERRASELSNLDLTIKKL